MKVDQRDTIIRHYKRVLKTMRQALDCGDTPMYSMASGQLDGIVKTLEIIGEQDLAHELFMNRFSTI